MIDEAYKNLANSIVILAVDDYRRILRDENIKYDGGRRVTLEELDEFFLSDWFYTLTNVDGITIINRLRREYQNECKTNTTNT